MSLKKIYEEQKQQNPHPSSSNTQLIELQMRRIAELEQIIAEQNEICKENERLRSENSRLRNRQFEVERKAEALNWDAKRRLEQDEIIKRRSDAELKKWKERLTVKTTVSTVALAIYTVVCTMILLFHHIDILVTIPEWFVNRAENINKIREILLVIRVWLNQIFAELMGETAAFVISWMVCIILGFAFALFFVIIVLVICRIVRETWKKYDEKQRAVSVALTAVAILLGTVCAEKLSKIEMNVVSWWISMGTGLNIFYKFNSRNI